MARGRAQQYREIVCGEVDEHGTFTSDPKSAGEVDRRMPAGDNGRGTKWFSDVTEAD